jgi:hypothetical protein
MGLGFSDVDRRKGFDDDSSTAGHKRLGVASGSRVDDLARAKDFHLVAVGILPSLLDGDNR